MVFSPKDSWDNADFVDLEAEPASELYNPEVLCMLDEISIQIDGLTIEEAISLLQQLK